MPAEWKFITPANHLTIFHFVSKGGSRRYNFVQLLVSGEIRHFFGIQPAWPELKRIPRERHAVEYTIRAFAQIPGTTTAPRSDIDATPVPSGAPGQTEYLLKLRGDEGREVQASLLITRDEPTYGEVVGDGRSPADEGEGG